MSDATSASQPLTLRSRSETPALVPYLAEVWSRRYFVLAQAAGQLRSQHLDTLLGNVWHVLNPLFLAGVYLLVFGVIIRTDRGIDNFVAFLAIGVFAFNFSQRTVTSCSSSIANNIGLIRSLQFPRAVLPLATVIVEMTAFGFGLVVTVVVLLSTGERPQLSWLLAPVIVVLLTMFSAGLGLIVARVADQVRDVSQILPYLFRITLYLSGIIFSVQGFVTADRVSNPEAVRRLFVLNPYFTYVDLLRDVLMSTYDAEFAKLELLYAAVLAPVALVLGIVVFRGGEKDYGRG